VLFLGWSSALIFLVISWTSNDWTWFPRGGAMLALCGFVVSVREALLFAPARPAIVVSGWIKNPSGFGNIIRRNALGVPVFNPAMLNLNADMTDEERQKLQDDWDWEVAHDTNDDEVIEPADPGRRMHDTAEMSPDELTRLRRASVFGAVGTFIWAFGDLIPKVLTIFMRV